MHQHKCILYNIFKNNKDQQQQQQQNQFVNKQLDMHVCVLIPK